MTVLERFSISHVVCTGPDICIGQPMRITQLNLRPESVMADLCLGATLVGINTLIGLGLFIVFI